MQSQVFQEEEEDEDSMSGKRRARGAQLPQILTICFHF